MEIRIAVDVTGAENLRQLLEKGAREGTLTRPQVRQTLERYGQELANVLYEQVVAGPHRIKVNPMSSPVARSVGYRVSVSQDDARLIVGFVNAPPPYLPYVLSGKRPDPGYQLWRYGNNRIKGAPIAHRLAAWLMAKGAASELRPGGSIHRQAHHRSLLRAALFLRMERILRQGVAPKPFIDDLLADERYQQLVSSLARDLARAIRLTPVQRVFRAIRRVIGR